jgi:hypothetical protein
MPQLIKGRALMIADFATEVFDGYFLVPAFCFLMSIFFVAIELPLRFK